MDRVTRRALDVLQWSADQAALDPEPGYDGLVGHCAFHLAAWLVDVSWPLATPGRELGGVSPWHGWSDCVQLGWMAVRWVPAPTNRDPFRVRPATRINPDTGRPGKVHVITPAGWARLGREIPPWHRTYWAVNGHPELAEEADNETDEEQS